MSTRRGEDWQCDHGAQYFTARDPGFRAEVARWQAAGAAAVWEPSLAVIGDADRHTPDPSLQRFVGVPRMTAPARLLADQLRVVVQRTVCAIAQTTAGWCVTSVEEGEVPYCFDAVVLAVPAPQAVPLLQVAAPRWAELARQVAMRACWALMLRYPARIALDFDAAFVNRGPLRWVARDAAKPGRPGRETWLLHAAAEWSEAHVEDSPEAVASQLLAAFAELGAPVPAAWSAHRWRYADSAAALELGCCHDASRRLGLCGDWLNGGKVEGAWLSGTALAGRMTAG